MNSRRISVFLGALTCLVAAQTSRSPVESQLAAQQSLEAADSAERLQHPNWLAPFIPTPEPVVVAALELAGVGENDLVYDLGSGDGRIILTAARRFDAKSVGIEWNQTLCDQTSAVIGRLGLHDRVKVIQGDIFKQDVSDATVVTGYLLPKSWERLAPILERQLRKGARVVSVNDPIPGWKAVEKIQIEHESRNTPWELYLYRVP